MNPAPPVTMMRTRAMPPDVQTAPRPIEFGRQARNIIGHRVGPWPKRNPGAAAARKASVLSAGRRAGSGYLARKAAVVVGTITAGSSPLPATAWASAKRVARPALTRKTPAPRAARGKPAPRPGHRRRWDCRPHRRRPPSCRDRVAASAPSGEVCFPGCHRARRCGQRQTFRGEHGPRPRVCCAHKLTAVLARHPPRTARRRRRERRSRCRPRSGRRLTLSPRATWRLLRVHRFRPRGIALAAIDVGVSGGMDDGVGSRGDQRALEPRPRR